MTSERQASAQREIRRAWISKHRTTRAAATAAAIVAACSALAALAAPPAIAASQLSWSGIATGGGALSGISCPSESLCVAVDASGSVLRTLNPSAATPAWSTVSKPSGSLSAISCASPALCVAVGGHQAFTSTDGGTSWSSASIAKSTLTSVSCPASNLCVAVDESGRVYATGVSGAERWPEAEIDIGNRLQSVSCASASSCVAVDTAGQAFGSERPGAGAWSRRRIDASALSAVSCAPSGPCVAVDSEGNALSSVNAGSSGSTWSSTPSGAAGPASAISCAASGLCVGVAGHFAFASDNPSATVPAWNRASPDLGMTLSGISCLPGGLCVAVDTSGRALSGRVPPPDVFTSPPAEAGTTEATLAGVINPHDALLGACVFEYGSSVAYGASVPCASLPSPAGGAQIVTASIGSLTPNTIYHYRLLAASLVGAGAGADQTFTTAASSNVARVAPHPSIHGTPAIGSRLSCASGVPSGAARLTYAWLRDLIPIPRATGSGYTVVGGDSGHHLQCEVTASNAGGTVTARSAFVTIPVQGVVAAAGETVVGKARFDKGGVRVPIRCSAEASSGCRLVIRLTGGARRALALGSARARFARGQRGTVFVSLNASGKRLLAHSRHPVARLTVTGTVIGVIEALLSRQRVRL
jgi:photosystem II stability/assembly factor-like uncharacterized protein